MPVTGFVSPESGYLPHRGTGHPVTLPPTVAGQAADDGQLRRIMELLIVILVVLAIIALLMFIVRGRR